MTDKFTFVGVVGFLFELVLEVIIESFWWCFCEIYFQVFCSYIE